MKKQLFLIAFTLWSISAWSQAELSSLKIAFYHSDSLNTRYTYLKEKDAELSKRQQQFEREVAVTQADLQSMYEKILDAEKKMLYTASELQMRKKEFQERAQNLELYQQTEGAKLQRDALELQTVLQNRISEFSRRYCEKNKIDMLIMHGPGGQFSFISPKLDVTKSFIDFVNAEQAKM